MGENRFTNNKKKYYNINWYASENIYILLYIWISSICAWAFRYDNQGESPLFAMLVQDTDCER